MDHKSPFWDINMSKSLLLLLSIFLFIRFLPEARKCDFFARRNAGDGRKCDFFVHRNADAGLKLVEIIVANKKVALSALGQMGYGFHTHLTKG